MRKLRLFVWGCGQVFEEHREIIKDEYIVAYVDADVNKQKVLHNKPVITPDEIPKHDMEFDYILIGSPKCESQIRQQAIELGICRDRILSSNLFYSPLESLSNNSYMENFESENVRVIKNWHYRNGQKTTIFAIQKKLGEICELLVIPCGCLGNEVDKKEVCILESDNELYRGEITQMTSIEIPVNSENMIVTFSISGMGSCFLQASFKEGPIAQIINSINNPETRQIFREELEFQFSMRYHERDYSVLERFADKTDYLILDIGANVGQSAMTFLEITNMDVISFEPHPSCMEPLSAVAKIFGKDRLQIINKGVGSCNGELAFYTPCFDTCTSQVASFSKEWVVDWIQKYFPNKSVDDSDMKEIKVPVVAVDDVLAEPSKPVFFVKIDAEGFEDDVMKGMQRTIKKDTPLFLLECSSMQKQIEILRYVNELHKYRIMYWDYEKGQFVETDRRGSINYFLVPQEGAIYKEIKELICQ